MTKTTLKDAAEGIGVAAIVISLIVLIVEVRQNIDLTRMQLEAEFIFATQELESHRLDPEMAIAWTKSLQNPQDLEDHEKAMLNGLLANQLQNWWLLIQMSETGLVSEQRVERAVNNQAPYYFGNTFAQDWWVLETVGWQGTRLLEVVDPVIRKQDPNFNARRLEKMVPE